MGLPFLSVVMPTYNGERYLQFALASIEAEGTEGIEVIAVDDGSTDGTLDVLDRFQSRLPLTIVTQRHGGNWTVGTNRAMSLARGEYLCWLHQDDVWRPGRLQRIRELVDQYPDAAWYFHSSDFIAPDGRSVGQWRCPFPSRTAMYSADEIWSRLLVQCYVATCAPVFSAKASQDIGGLDEQLWYSADWDFWLRLSQLGKGVYDPHPWSGFRIHAASQTATRFFDSSDLERQQRSVLQRHLKTWRIQNGRESVERLAQLSITMNIALASFTAGRRVNWRSIFGDAWQVRPWHWWRFLNHSRLWDRAVSRWRLRQEFTAVSQPMIPGSEVQRVNSG
jgi:glycosyltransferase involved in cell wall biosynthesis